MNRAGQNGDEFGGRGAGEGRGDGRRVDTLLDMLRVFSRLRDPQELVGRFGDALRQVVRFDAILTLSVRGLEPGQYKITRKYFGANLAGPATDPWRDWAMMPTHSGGLVGRLIGEAKPAIINDLRVESDPVLGGELRGFRSCLALPLFDAGEPLNWCLLFRRDAEPFGAADLEMALINTNLVGQVMRNLIAVKQVGELNRKMHAQLEQVAEIQRLLLPERPPVIPGVAIDCFYQPCEQAGGDYYDFAPMTMWEAQPASAANAGHWGFIVADVAGHGASAAVIMAMLQALIHGYAAVPGTPATLLRHLNRYLVRERLTNSFVTAFAATLDPETRRLIYACAGHPPPRVKKPGANSPVRRLATESAIPLGIMEDFEVGDNEAELSAGETVILYTDGIIESFDPEGRMFGVKRLDETILACSGEPACVIQSITTALRNHERGRPPADDQTIIAMRTE